MSLYFTNVKYNMMARSHGLSLPVHADAACAPEVAALTQAIAGAGASDARRAAALRIAEAETDALRVRRVRARMLAEALAAGKVPARLMRIDRYERRASPRRKVAMAAFDAVP
jgi:hypothetical protein